MRAVARRVGVLREKIRFITRRSERSNLVPRQENTKSEVIIIAFTFSASKQRAQSEAFLSGAKSLPREMRDVQNVSVRQSSHGPIPIRRQLSANSHKTESHSEQPLPKRRHRRGDQDRCTTESSLYERQPHDACMPSRVCHPGGGAGGRLVYVPTPVI